MISKHDNVGDSVYWDDIIVPGWKLSGDQMI
jgi:hypothetical protein